MFWQDIQRVPTLLIHYAKYKIDELYTTLWNNLGIINEELHTFRFQNAAENTSICINNQMHI